MHNPDTGDKILTTQVSTAAAGSNCGAGSTDPACATAVPVAMITMTTAAASHHHARRHGQLHHHHHQHRPGRDLATTVTVPLAGVLDDAAYNSDAAATTGLVPTPAPT